MKPHSACAPVPCVPLRTSCCRRCARRSSSALICSFVRAITTVSAIVFLVTPDTRVATAYILNRVEDGEYGVAIAYGSILIVVMLAIIFIFDWLIGESRTSRSKAKTRRNGAHYDSEKFR